jgi:hypothetical protein
MNTQRYINHPRGDGTRYPIQQAPTKDYLTRGILPQATASLYWKRQHKMPHTYKNSIITINPSFTTPSFFAQYGKGRGTHRIAIHRKKQLIA